MFDKYQKSPNPDTADELLKSLNNSRKEKWNELRYKGLFKIYSNTMATCFSAHYSLRY
jgi:hypothetical protein